KNKHPPAKRVDVYSMEDSVTIQSKKPVAFAFKGDAQMMEMADFFVLRLYARVQTLRTREEAILRLHR
ncbi:MAG: hypothetical protein IJB99_03455, partial [Clostridia bacterium]|nr:hypothetical protein [Clostridia bacterium]